LDQRNHVTQDDRSRVWLFSTIELVNALEQEKRIEELRQLALRQMFADIEIFDGPGYLQFVQNGGDSFTCSANFASMRA
jgi:hypothetical protein